MNSREEQLNKALKLLMEWVWVWPESDGNSTGWNICRLCDGADWRGHRSNCELLSILTGLGVNPTITPQDGRIKIELPS